jgi:hypothetical protein
LDLRVSCGLATVSGQPIETMPDVGGNTCVPPARADLPKGEMLRRRTQFMEPSNAVEEANQIEAAILTYLGQKPSLPSDTAAASADAASAPSLEPGAQPKRQDRTAAHVVRNIVVTYNLSVQLPSPWPSEKEATSLEGFTQQSFSSAVEASSEGTAASGAELWDRRVQRARKAGEFARQKLLGEIERVPKTPSVPGAPLQSCVWVVLRALPGIDDFGQLVGPYKNIAGYVECADGNLGRNGGLPRLSVRRRGASLLERSWLS